MRAVIGLGNPGAEYVATRHNAGVMLVDKLAQRLNSDYGWRKFYDAMVFKTEDLWLVKTKSVFMNESGKLLLGLPEGELWVAHDDLDLKLGEYKIQKGKGPKGHNGVESVENALKTKDFWRIRIGIDNRTSSSEPVSGEEYVLQRFTAEERGILERVLDEICKTNFR